MTRATWSVVPLLLLTLARDAGAQTPASPRVFFPPPRVVVFTYLYAADTKEAAMAEVLVRDLPVDGPARLIPKAAILGRLLTKVEIVVDLQVVSLEGPDLGHVGQDAWLTKCDASEYATTRAWAVAIRRWVPAAAGFVWRSKRDERWLAYVFFDDRLPTQNALVKTGRSQKLDQGRGLDAVRATLARHNVALAP